MAINLESPLDCSFKPTLSIRQKLFRYNSRNISKHDNCVKIILTLCGGGSGISYHKDRAMVMSYPKYWNICKSGSVNVNLSDLNIRRDHPQMRIPPNSTKQR
ncbi:uncharacterized protein LOC126893844 [Daktulosphaira vitifoliae]|uniref:uncharacterized protein LOC126893844 n=1 Tax=Daktulosphaira vitifoliae TaxID=58002 RepID=UPI0021A97B18|nr:uncharacterized protein LOC126893844 [Daktulosphaira vitifoliae]